MNFKYKIDKEEYIINNGCFHDLLLVNNKVN